MLKKSLIFCFMWIYCTSLLMAQGGSMTDQQVVKYVEMGLQQGKSQQQISTELARKGVTKEQAERAKRLFEQGQQNGENESKTDQRRNQETLASDKNYVNRDFNFEKGSKNNEKVNRFVTNQELIQGQTITLQLDENGNLVSNDITIFKDVQTEEQIFGRNIFKTQNLTFEPSTNLPTPSNYQLGPGDEIIIDIWGVSQVSIQKTISPDGAINIDNLGLVFINGMTVHQATSYLCKELNKIYAGLDGEEPSSHLKVSLVNNRSIQVNVMGEVFLPGTYTLSSFSTVFHALYSAGGVSDIGSLRNIQVVRDGKTIANVDVYDFIMQGKTKDDIHLQEGDVIIVPP